MNKNLVSNTPYIETETLELLKGIAAADNLNPDDLISEFFPQNVTLSLKQELLLHFNSFQVEYQNLRGNHNSRLHKLRQKVKSMGLNGFIVPKADEHQGEYIAKRSERLLWLAGFSGSAGLAIVLLKAAALFVDGRYTLQAKTEVDKSAYEQLPFNLIEIENWLTKNLALGNKLAFDPWLHSEQQVDKLRNVCNQKGVELIGLEQNLIDSIWHDQPPKPVSLSITHELKYAGKTSREKRHTLSKKLLATHSDALVISAPDSIAWLLNIRGKDVPFNPFTLSFAIYYKDSSVDWFVDSRKITSKLRKNLGSKIRVKKPETLERCLITLAEKGKTIHICDSTAPFCLIQLLAEKGAKIVRGSDPCQLLKACKNEAEVCGAREAHVRDGIAVVNFLHWLSRSGNAEKESELSAALFLENQRKKQKKFKGPSFPTICGIGPNGAIIHYIANEKTNRKFKPGSLCLIDSGGQYLEGTTDITRTIAIGRPSAEIRTNFTLVLKGHIALASAKFPMGTTGSQLDILARKFLWHAGLDYSHGTGHGVGSYLSVHEGPQRIGKITTNIPLEPGMIISNEPGYYKTGEYGIRIENLILVKTATHKKKQELKLLEFETLTLAPIDRSLIEPKLMTDAEVKWVNSYHYSVRKKLSPLLDKQTRAWIHGATSPINR